MASPDTPLVESLAASSNQTSTSPRTSVLRHRAPIGVVLDVVDLISDDEEDVKKSITEEKIKQPGLASAATRLNNEIPSTISKIIGSVFTKTEEDGSVIKKANEGKQPNVENAVGAAELQQNFEIFADRVKAEIAADLIPSTSRGIVDIKEMGEIGDYEFEDENDEAEEMEVEEDEEDNEEQDENGIPLSAIARLSDSDKKRLKTLTEVNSALNAKIAELERHITESDEENIELNAQLAEYTAKSEKILDAMIKLCKLDDDSYDEPDITDLPSFRFSNSGHKYLDKALTVLVQACLEEEYGKSKNSSNSKKRQSMIKNFKDLSPNKISSVITAIAKRESGGKPGSRLLHRQTKRPIVAQDVLESLHQALRKFRSKIFNRTVIPKYSTNGDRNPALPNDPELLARLKEHSGKLLSESIRDFAGEFEENKRKLGLAVDRDGDSSSRCVEESSHVASDSDSENEDNSGNSRVLEDGFDIEVVDSTGRENMQNDTHTETQTAEVEAETSVADQLSASPSADIQTDDEDDDEGFDAMELLENIDVE